jgi:hypothetical protein
MACAALLPACNFARHEHPDAGPCSNEKQSYRGRVSGTSVEANYLIGAQWVAHDPAAIEQQSTDSLKRNVGILSSPADIIE